MTDSPSRSSAIQGLLSSLVAIHSESPDKVGSFACLFRIGERAMKTLMAATEARQAGTFRSFSISGQHAFASAPKLGDVAETAR